MALVPSFKLQYCIQIFWIKKEKNVLLLGEGWEETEWDFPLWREIFSFFTRVQETPRYPLLPKTRTAMRVALFAWKFCLFMWDKQRSSSQTTLATLYAYTHTHTVFTDLTVCLCSFQKCRNPVMSVHAKQHCFSCLRALPLLSDWAQSLSFGKQATTLWYTSLIMNWPSSGTARQLYTSELDLSGRSGPGVCFADEGIRKYEWNHDKNVSVFISLGPSPRTVWEFWQCNSEWYDHLQSHRS